MRTPASHPIDDRLRELLAVEQRLQILVADAREAAGLRIREARADAARRLSEADATIAADDEAQVRADRAVHDAALAALQADHELALAALGSLTHGDIDRMAHEVLRRLLADLGGAS